jgi:hypothetical protein
MSTFWSLDFRCESRWNDHANRIDSFGHGHDPRNENRYSILGWRFPMSLLSGPGSSAEPKANRFRLVFRLYYRDSEQKSFATRPEVAFYGGVVSYVEQKESTEPAGGWIIPACENDPAQTREQIELTQSWAILFGRSQ